MPSDPSLFLEDRISQIPALQLLQNLGWQYLTLKEVNNFRSGRISNVFLEDILTKQLRKINRIRFKQSTHAFSDANIYSAVQALKDIPYDGLVRTNEKIYDLLLLGKSLPQTIDGNTKSFQLKYIDWDPETWLTNNVFHVTQEFEVECTRTTKTRRPDIVLFVNGIPLILIECKRPDLKGSLQEAISQHLRNQRDDEIPGLFIYSQILLAITKNEAQYGTTGTPEKFWSTWREKPDKQLKELINKPLTKDQNKSLFSEESAAVVRHFNELGKKRRQTTFQDNALFQICRRERALELIHSFILFDAGEKKIARYQQYFTVKNTLKRIEERDEKGSRKGGVVWHTQGSGKSLTMVMLAKAITRLALPDYKILLVTDRVDLDDQIYRTFSHCDLAPQMARSGLELAKLLTGSTNRVVTTVIDKFDNAVTRARLKNDSENIFVLVDESHRGQYSEMHARMRKALPKGCFIGFTGTPIRKKEKDTINRFGGLIQPTYTMLSAVEDGAVVPLLYEGRDVEQRVDTKSIDRWFDLITSNLSKEQTSDLKKKFSAEDQLNKAEQKVREIALDISLHFKENWKGTPYKAQLVAPYKTTALLYKKYLDEFGLVTSEVLISAPDDRTGHQEVEGSISDQPEVQRFWTKMMSRYGSEDNYNKTIINSFKTGENPEIIIVVDKLLTGFDAPRNTILYLTRPLKDHTLLQAIARVNRLYEGKDFGYIIDYSGVLGNLKTAFDFYNELDEGDQKTLEDSLTNVSEEIAKLPSRHTDLVNLFQDIKNTYDEESYERKLSDQETREAFYELLRDYARSLSTALSSTFFIEETAEKKIQQYKKDLTFFMRLRSAVRQRYAEDVNFKEYEPRIQKLIDTHVATGKVEPITKLVNIFDKEFEKELERLEDKSLASKADTIAHRTKKTIDERINDDPVFYEKFSELLNKTIQEFRQKRLADAEYLKKVVDIQKSVSNQKADNLPASLSGHDVASAFYGIVQKCFKSHTSSDVDLDELAAIVALKIDEIICKRKIVNWTKNADVQNQMRNEIEDYLHDLDNKSIDLTFDEIDEIMEDSLSVALRRYSE